VLLALLYFRSRARARSADPVIAWGTGRVATFLLGLLLVWGALDWPIGTLGGGYLASMHSVQWLLLSQVAPPFLILGVPPAAWRRLGASPRWAKLLHRAAGGIFGLVMFNGVLLVTHVPTVTDALMASQLGSFTIDAAWFLSGLALWWPVLAPPGLGRLNEPLKIGYLFAATIVPTVPAAMLTFSGLPVYKLYELAPRVGNIQAHSDQQMAGLLMKAIADPIMWVSMAIVFFRWSAMERRADQAEAAAR
jgi:putative membrane protein